MNPIKFEVAGGSVPGRDHLFQGGLLIGKNCQDAYSWRALWGGNALVAVVCDGCGSHKNSEVGAKLGAEIIISAIERRLMPETRELSKAFWETVRQDVLAQLRMLALSMAGSTSFTQTVSENFLFTVVGTLVTPEACWVFNVGDGIVAVDGELKTFGPFPDNTPPYLAYGIIDSTFSSKPELLTFQVSKYPALKQAVLIGSDGAGELVSLADRQIPSSTELVGSMSQFWLDGKYFKNKDLVRRRLTRLNSLQIRTEGGATNFVPGLLQDDTTLVVVRPAAVS